MSDTETLESLETEIDRARLELEKTKRELEEKKAEVKAIPAREVSEDEMIIVKKQVNMSSEKKALKEKIETQKAYDNVMLTGKFMNLRVPGKTEKLPYMKYEDDPVKWYTFNHGQVYTIPRGFADQINDHYHTPRFVQRQGPMSPDNPESQIAEVDTSNKKFAFVPVNF